MTVRSQTAQWRLDIDQEVLAAGPERRLFGLVSEKLTNSTRRLPGKRKEGRQDHIILASLIRSSYVKRPGRPPDPDAHRALVRCLVVLISSGVGWDTPFHSKPQSRRSFFLAGRIVLAHSDFNKGISQICFIHPGNQRRFCNSR